MLAYAPASTKQRSPEPSPTAAAIPSILHSADNADRHEEALRYKFKKFWMASLADAFKDDLEEIRKEPGMTTARLAILIDSLASGAEVFSAPSRLGTSEIVNEMEVILGSPSTK